MSNTAELKVTAIGGTFFGWGDAERTTDNQWLAEMDASHSDSIAEFAGRACYQSWSRPNSATATNEAYLAHILEVGHLSVLEHGSASFYIEGVSRSLTHELVRHRHFSFSQLSQRYVDEQDAKYVIPPALRNDALVKSVLEDQWTDTLEVYEFIAERLIEKGATRKEARQTARSVLPNMTETKIVVSGNHRSWREFLLKRGSAAADTEIRELAVAVYLELQTIAPNIYQDIEMVDLVGGAVGLEQV